MLKEKRITGARDNAAARRADEIDKGVAFKSRAPFSNCISEINNTRNATAKEIDIVMPMYNLIEYSDNYSKTSEVYGKITEMNQMII